MIRKSAALLPLLALAACTGAGGETYIGRPGSPAWFATASVATQTSYFQERCANYGFPANSPQMAQCVQNEYLATRQVASQKQATGLALIAASAAPPPAPRMVNCTTTRNGPFLNTNCY